MNHCQYVESFHVITFLGYVVLLIIWIFFYCREKHMPWPTRTELHGFIQMVDLEREKIERFLCFLGRRQNISPNSIIRNPKTLEGKIIILIIFIYMLYIEEYESPWWRTQIYDSRILDVEREKLYLLAPRKPVELVKLTSCYVETMYGTHIQMVSICANLEWFLSLEV